MRRPEGERAEHRRAGGILAVGGQPEADGQARRGGLPRHESPRGQAVAGRILARWVAYRAATPVAVAAVSATRTAAGSQTSAGTPVPCSDPARATGSRTARIDPTTVDGQARAGARATSSSAASQAAIAKSRGSAAPAVPFGSAGRASRWPPRPR